MSESASRTLNLSSSRTNARGIRTTYERGYIDIDCNFPRICDPSEKGRRNQIQPLAAFIYGACRAFRRDILLWWDQLVTVQDRDIFRGDTTEDEHTHKQENEQWNVQ